MKALNCSFHRLRRPGNLILERVMVGRRRRTGPGRGQHGRGLIYFQDQNEMQNSMLRLQGTILAPDFVFPVNRASL